MIRTVLLLTSKPSAPRTAIERLLVTRLRARGIEPVVAVPAPGSLSEYAKSVDVTVEYVPGDREWRKVKKLPRLLATLVALARITRRYRIDLVHSLIDATALEAIAVSGLMRVPHLCHIRFIYDVPAKYRKLWLHRARAVVAITRAALSSFLASRRQPPDVLAIVPECIDPAIFRAEAAIPAGRKGLGLPDDVFVAGMVGMLDERKDPLTLIRAVAALSPRRADIHVALVGAFRKPAYEEETRALANAMGLRDRVHFFGYVENVSPILASIDVLVHPARSEAQGRVLLEAMAHAKPVVASRVDGIPEVVEDGVTGLLCSVGDAEAFASALEQLAAMPALGERLGVNGRARVERFFNWDYCLDEIVKVYRQVERHH